MTRTLSRLCALAHVQHHGFAADAAPSWRPLLDAKLSQFDVYLSYRGDQIMSVIQGNGAQRPQARSGSIPGPERVHVIEQDGKPVLRISGEIYGCAADAARHSRTTTCGSRFKWGEKKWEPRLDRAQGLRNPVSQPRRLRRRLLEVLGAVAGVPGHRARARRVLDAGDVGHRHPRAAQGAGRGGAALGSGGAVDGVRLAQQSCARGFRRGSARASGTGSSSSASRTTACTSSTARWSWRWQCALQGRRQVGADDGRQAADPERGGRGVLPRHRDPPDSRPCRPSTRGISGLSVSARAA